MTFPFYGSWDCLAFNYFVEMEMVCISGCVWAEKRVRELSDFTRATNQLCDASAETIKS